MKPGAAEIEANTPKTEAAEVVTARDASTEGSVHNILHQIRDRRRWEPPETAGEPEGQEETPDQALPEDKGEPAEEETPDQAPQGQEETDGPKLKYKSQEEAERAYREAERRMHQATMEKAKLAQELEALKERLAALEKAPEAPPVNDAEAVGRIVDINSRIDDLDPYDPDYARQKAILEMEKAILLDSVRQRQAMPSPDAIKEIVQQELAARQQQEKEARELEDLVRQAVSLAQAHGLDMTPGSWDHRQFWRAVRAGEAPEGDLETQVKALAQEILQDKATLGQTAAQNMQRVHTENAVLGRGGPGPGSVNPENYRPSTIHEILASNRRRI
ncbi:MAG: hypothetical protein K6T55_12695 [Syntrophobacterales bacterium]|nr:hypothetical protein [Syntrophobacterales bacterium]